MRAHAAPERAILDDFPGFDADLVVAHAYRRDGTVRLPAGFELTGEQPQSWINDGELFSVADYEVKMQRTIKPSLGLVGHVHR